VILLLKVKAKRLCRVLQPQLMAPAACAAAGSHWPCRRLSARLAVLARMPTACIVPLSPAHPRANLPALMPPA
jgi:hypothetical protein